MDTSGKTVRDPAAHQPTKAEMEEDVRIDATPEALAWAVTRGGAERREDAKSTRPTRDLNEMMNELIQHGYIVPDNNEYYQPVMPSAFQAGPSFTTADSIPLKLYSDGD